MAEPVLHKGQKRDRSWLRCYANRVTMVEQHYTNVLQLAVCRPKLHGVVQVTHPSRLNLFIFRFLFFFAF